MIERYAKAGRVTVVVDDAGSTIEIGDYLFSREEFHHLLRYLWGGGYPAWKAGSKTRLPDRYEGTDHRFTPSPFR